MQQAKSEVVDCTGIQFTYYFSEAVPVNKPGRTFKIIIDLVRIYLKYGLSVENNDTVYYSAENF